MKVAVIGSGKLANEVLKLLPERSIVGVYDSHHLPIAQSLREAEVLIVSVLSTDIPILWPLILESTITAFWENDLTEGLSDIFNQVKAQKTRWIFSCQSDQAANVLSAAKSLVSHPAIDYGAYPFSEC